MNAIPDAAAPPPATVRRIFRLPLFVRLLSLFGTVFIGAVSLFMIAAAVFVLTQEWALGLLMAAIACFCAGLAHYVWRDLRGKWGLRAILDPDTVALALPAGRSLIHRPPAQRLTIPYADIDAIETRLEAYGSFGMEMMQRAYVLRRRNGELIFLFEDRALGTRLQTSFFADIAAELAARANVPLRDLGMVESSGGVLGVWGAHSVDWAAPSLPRARQLRLWRHVSFTGALALAMVVIALALRLALGVP